MKLYQTIGSIICISLWGYVVYFIFSSMNVFKEKIGKGFLFLLNPLNSFKIKNEIGKHKELADHYQQYKLKARKLFLLWFATCFLYVIVAAIIENS